MFSPHLALANRSVCGKLEMKRLLIISWTRVKIDAWACLKSFRTTSIGLAMIAVGVLRMLGYEVDSITTSPELLISFGLGLVFAQDARIQF